MHYTREQIDDMKARCDLVGLASWCGYTPVKKGHTYSLQEHDSVRIFNHQTFMQYSSSIGGDAIVFLQHFMNCSWQEAVEKLSEFAGINTDMRRNHIYNVHEVKKERAPFVLPEAAENYRRLYAYLLKTRKIDKSVVDYCVKNHLIYESAEHHNIVFLSRDKDGIVHHAFMRGTNDAYPYKGDVEGNDKRYGFNIPVSGKKLRVFEAAIDALSEWSITKDSSVSRLALGMLSDAPLETFLKEHPDVKEIDLCLDGDEPGREAAKRISEKYIEKGYKVAIKHPVFPEGKEGKDFNDLCRMLAGKPRQAARRYSGR